MTGLLARLAMAVLILSLALWLAAILSAGIAAANVFPTMDEWPVQNDTYRMLEHTEQSRLIAGHIMDGVFRTVDVVLMIAIFGTSISLVVLYLSSPSTRGMMGWLLGALVAMALAMFVSYATIVPHMQELLEQRWVAASVGDRAAMHQLTEQFEPLHDRSNLLFRVQLVCVVSALGVLGLWFGEARSKVADIVAASKGMNDRNDRRTT